MTATKRAALIVLLTAAVTLMSCVARGVPQISSSPVTTLPSRAVARVAEQETSQANALMQSDCQLLADKIVNQNRDRSLRFQSLSPLGQYAEGLYCHGEVRWAESESDGRYTSSWAVELPIEFDSNGRMWTFFEGVSGSQICDAFGVPHRPPPNFSVPNC